MAHSNGNFERTTRTKERNARPPAGEQGERPKQAAKRGKQWSRDGDKRDNWQSISVTGF